MVTIRGVLSDDSFGLVRDRNRARWLLISDDNPVDFEALHERLGPESLRVLLGLTRPGILRPSRVQGTPVLVVAAGEDRFYRLAEQRRTARALGAPPSGRARGRTAGRADRAVGRARARPRALSRPVLA